MSGHPLADWLRLTLAPGIGGETQRRLLAAFGLPEQILAAGRSALAGVVGSRAAAALLDADTGAAVDATLAWLETPGHHLITLADPAYPPGLLEIPDPPTVLYVRGRCELLARPALAVVGSRNATPQGARDAERFAHALARAGLAVVSGLALGIDAAAHRGALAAGGETVAVIGTGADRLYPARNRELALAIAEHGAIVSEFPLGTPALAGNFPRRNRLISGLARGVLVVEAAVGSGSLITARLAAEQGRDVFAIPGSIHSPVARGCHRLIRQGAKLVETVDDILEDLAWPSPPPAHDPTAGADTPAADEAATRLLERMGPDPCSIDELVARSGLTAEAVSVILLTLELDGRIAPCPGARYQRLT